MRAKSGQKRISCGLTTEEIPGQRQKKTVPLEGLEPPTVSLGRNCSSIELQRLAASSLPRLRSVTRVSSAAGSISDDDLAERAAPARRTRAPRAPRSRAKTRSMWIRTAPVDAPLGERPRSCAGPCLHREHAQARAGEPPEQRADRDAPAAAPASVPADDQIACRPARAHDGTRTPSAGRRGR